MLVPRQPAASTSASGDTRDTRGSLLPSQPPPASTHFPLPHYLVLGGMVLVSATALLLEELTGSCPDLFQGNSGSRLRPACAPPGWGVIGWRGGLGPQQRNQGGGGGRGGRRQPEEPWDRLPPVQRRQPQLGEEALAVDSGRQGGRGRLLGLDWRAAGGAGKMGMRGGRGGASLMSAALDGFYSTHRRNNSPNDNSSSSTSCSASSSRSCSNSLDINTIQANQLDEEDLLHDELGRVVKGGEEGKEEEGEDNSYEDPVKELVVLVNSALPSLLQRRRSGGALSMLPGAILTSAGAGATSASTRAGATSTGTGATTIFAGERATTSTAKKGGGRPEVAALTGGLSASPSLGETCSKPR